MKRTLALIMAAVLVLSLAACGSKSSADVSEYTAKISELEQKNAELQAQVDDLTAQLLAAHCTELNSWELKAEPRQGGSSALVSFTAVPAAYQEGQAVSLQIILDGEEVQNVPCTWDGSSYSAAVELTAADGYGYYCLMSADGTDNTVELNTEDHPNNEELVYLETSMTTLCSLYVDENAWSWDAGTKVLTVAPAMRLCSCPA